MEMYLLYIITTIKLIWLNVNVNINLCKSCGLNQLSHYTCIIRDYEVLLCTNMKLVDFGGNLVQMHKTKAFTLTR